MNSNYPKSFNVISPIRYLESILSGQGSPCFGEIEPELDNEEFQNLNNN